MAEPHDLDDIPAALAAPRRETGLQLVWIIPLVAAFIGGWIAIRAILERGPTVTISFLTAEGLEPGKTRVRYKDVDIGEVKTVAIAEDRTHIIVTAEFTKEASRFLTSDTRFWVVKPRISGSQISGVATLLSGAYIALDAGHSSKPRRDFAGLEVAPILTGDLPGRQFMVESQDLGSLDIGSPIYFRHIKVGEVVATELDANGTDVHIQIFVHAPYDRFVTPNTRFWNASGVDVHLDANGLKVETQSLAAILTGGLAFETPPFAAHDGEAATGTKFPLFKDREAALKLPDGDAQIFVMNFKDSLRGLAVGAPVDFRGIVVGEVESIDLAFDDKAKLFYFPVRIALFPHRMRARLRDTAKTAMAETERESVIRSMIANGFRAQLRTGSLLTGQLYVALDFFPDAQPARLNWNRRPLEIPTVPGTVDELQQSVTRILRDLERIPFGEIGAETRTTLLTVNTAVTSLNGLIRRLDGELSGLGPESKKVLSDSRATLEELRKALAGMREILATDSPLQTDLRGSLREISRAADSVRSLADTLEREPESLLRGKHDD